MKTTVAAWSRLRTLAVAAVAGLGAHQAQCQTYPAQPIRLLVPFPAGGGSDATARSLAAKLAERLGQRVIVDNRPGAAGTLGAELAARGAPDGYSLLLGSASELVFYPALASKMAYDVLRDFEPVAMISEIAFMLVVHPSLPARSVGDLVALAKRRPGQIGYGTAGTGAVSHLAMAHFCDLAGIDMLHVPYKSTSLAAAGLLGGQLQAMMPPMPAALPYTAAGRLRALAVSSAERWPTAPALPTLAESGLPGYRLVRWTGLLAPVNTPADIVERLHGAIAQALAAPDVVQALARQGALAHPMDPARFGAYLRTELERWAEVGRRTGIRVD